MVLADLPDATLNRKLHHIECGQDLGTLHAEIDRPESPDEVTAQTAGGAAHRFSFTFGDNSSEFEAAKNGLEWLKLERARRASQFAAAPTPPIGVKAVMTDPADEKPLEPGQLLLLVADADAMQVLTSVATIWTLEDWEIWMRGGDWPNAYAILRATNYVDISVRLDLDAPSEVVPELVEELAQRDSLEAQIRGTGPLSDRPVSVVALPAPRDPAGNLAKVAAHRREIQRRDQEDEEAARAEARSDASILKKLLDRVRRSGP